jgi:hypothetical protein
MENSKKRAAALAAVANYIKSEQEALIAAQTACDSGTSKRPFAGVGAWSLSGRQSQMQMRGLMQMKSFHGARLR